MKNILAGRYYVMFISCDICLCILYVGIFFLFFHQRTKPFSKRNHFQLVPLTRGFTPDATLVAGGRSTAAPRTR